MTKGKAKEVGSIQVDKYISRANEAWDEAWAIFTDQSGWSTEGGQSNPSTGCVYSKKIKGHGKVFKLEAVMSATPVEVYDVLVNGVCDWPKWNPTILDCKMLQTLNDNTDVSYSAAVGQLGGLVASRDFVNIRHWKSHAGLVMSAACAVTHPDMPPLKGHVRAENHPASYVFECVDGEPDKCKFTCILSTDLKGWMPQWMIDAAMSAVLLQYLHHLGAYLEKRRQDGGQAANQDINQLIEKLAIK